MSLHEELSAEVISHCGERLQGVPRQSFDAMTITFDNGLDVELRFAGDGEYCIAWQWQGEIRRIDTAPLHPGLATFPNHLHTADGGPQPDPLTVPGRTPWENLRAVLDALLQDPRLGG